MQHMNPKQKSVEDLWMMLLVNAETRTKNSQDFWASALFLSAFWMKFSFAQFSTDYHATVTLKLCAKLRKYTGFTLSILKKTRIG